MFFIYKFFIFPFYQSCYGARKKEKGENGKGRGVRRQRECYFSSFSSRFTDTSWVKVKYSRSTCPKILIHLSKTQHAIHV